MTPLGFISYKFLLEFLINCHINYLIISYLAWWKVTLGFFIRKDEEKVIELFDAIGKLKAQFDSIERPNLELENPPPKTETPPTEKQQDAASASAQGADPSKVQTGKMLKSPTAKSDQVLDHEAELARLESEFGGVGQEYSTEEIGDWEFDELERELTSGNSATAQWDDSLTILGY